MRLCGFCIWASSRFAYTHPNVAPYQLGYTRILNFTCGRRCGQLCGQTAVFWKNAKQGSAEKVRFHAPLRVLRFGIEPLCVHAPKAGALPAALHPVGVRMRSLRFSFRRRALPIGEKVPHPLPHSSFPNQIRKGIWFGCHFGAHDFSTVSEKVQCLCFGALSVDSVSNRVVSLTCMTMRCDTIYYYRDRGAGYG